MDGFFSRVRYSHGCWSWIGYKHRGYGRYRFNGEMIGAHRISYAYFVEPLVPGMDICHHCDNPSCVNPFHLFQGTRSDNMFDMSNKGRHKNGIKTHCKNGHPLSGDNLKITTRPNGTINRHCVTCWKESNRRYHQEYRKKGLHKFGPRNKAKIIGFPQEAKP